MNDINSNLDAIFEGIMVLKNTVYKSCEFKDLKVRITRPFALVANTNSKSRALNTKASYLNNQSVQLMAQQTMVHGLPKLTP